MQREEAKERVRKQYGAAGDAYVRSAGHAGGNDLLRLVEAIAPQAHERALDIATGGGHVAKAVAPHVREVVVTDLTPEMLASAERFLTGEGLTDLTFELADAEALPFADDDFDIVTCRIAPHHFPHPDRFVAEVARVLRDGGRFLLIDSTVPPGALGERFNRFELARDPSHVRSLTIDEWTQLIGDAGLRIETVEHFPKRHVFRDWAARSRVADGDIQPLARHLLDGGPDIAEIFKIEREGDELLAFTDQKTLFLATKSGNTRTV